MIIITKENKKNYKTAGTFVVLGLDNQPVLKNNGQPWSGKTNCMSNYYGIIVGAGKYAAVKTSAIWKPEYTIGFIPQEGETTEQLQLGENIEEVVEQDHNVKDGAIIKMNEYDFDFTYQDKTLPAHVIVELYDDDDLYITCKLGKDKDQWKGVWFEDAKTQKELCKQMNKVEELHMALENSVLETIGDDFEYDKNAISWSNLLTEGDFIMKAFK